MKPRFEIVLTNAGGGRLDDRKAYNREELKNALVALARSVSEYYDGDCIRVIDHQAEELGDD